MKTLRDTLAVMGICASLLLGATLRAAAPDAKTVGWIDLDKPLTDSPPPVVGLAPGEQIPSMRQLLAQLKYVGDHKTVQGVVIHLDEPDLTLEQIDQLHTAFAKVRAAGKKVIVFAETYDLRSYFLAAGADKIMLQNKGTVELAGMGSEEMYLAGLFEKLGVKADMLQVGKFKGASETYMRTGPSPEWSRNMDGLLDDMFDQIQERIAKGRGLDRAALTKAMADSWSMSEKDYVDRKLIDGVTRRDMVEAMTREFGAQFTWDQKLGKESDEVQATSPLAMLSLLMQENKTHIVRPTIVIIHLNGTIVSGESGQPSLLGGSQTIGSRTIQETINEVRDEPLVKGVILKIDSPGGSAQASEVIWQAVRELRDTTHPARPGKPVYVSVGGMAASGGYYIASAADEIYVNPTSIVGSIGVVGGKIALGGLYDKLGVTVHRRTRGPMGDIFNSVEPFSVQERAGIEASMNRVYDQFLDRVKTGRARRLKDIDAVAQGRIFTGRQAKENGLVDKIGSVELALSDLVAQLKLEEGKFDVVDLPEPSSIADFLQGLLGGVAAAGGNAPPLAAAGENAAVLQGVRALIGPAAWRQLSAALDGAMLLRTESVLTFMPAVFTVK